jgi:uncharacterized membrane protein
LTIDSTIIVIAIAGLLVSSYFTALAYRWIGPDERWIPRFCRLGDRTCAAIVFTPRARVFGLPNSVLGQMYYASLIVGTPLNLLDRSGYYTLFLAASLLTVLLAVYLTYSLLFITRVPCVLCFASHAANVTIFLLLLAHR